MESAALRIILEVPELYGLVNSYYEWALPPAQPITTTVTLVVGLGRSSAALLVAATAGARWGFRQQLWEILQLWKLEAERIAREADPAYVSLTP